MGPNKLPPNIPERVTVADFARLEGVGYHAILQRIRRGGITRDADGMINVAQARAQWAKLGNPAQAARGKVKGGRRGRRPKNYSILAPIEDDPIPPNDAPGKEIEEEEEEEQEQEQEQSRTLVSYEPPRKQSAPADDGGPESYSEAQRQREWERVRKERLANDREEKLLVNAARIESIVAEAAQTACQHILGLPDKISQELAAMTDPREIRTFLHRELTGTLASLGKLIPQKIKNAA